MLEDTDAIWVILWMKDKGLVLSQIDRQNNQWPNNQIPFSNPIVVNRRQGGEDVALNGVIWSTDVGANCVASYDTRTQKAGENIAVSSPYAIAASEDAVWVAGFTREGSKYQQHLYRIDPRTQKVIVTIPLDYQGLKIAHPDTLWVMVDKMAVGHGFLWATATTYKKSLVTTNPDQGFLLKIDPQTNRVIETIAVGSAANAITISKDAVWTSNAYDSTVTRVDPLTNKVVATIPTAKEPKGLATGSGRIWVAAYYDGVVQQIETQTNQVAQTIFVGNLLGHFYPRIAINKETIWVMVLGPGSDFNVNYVTHKIKRVTP